MRTYQRKGVWYIDYSFNGRRVRKKVGTSRRFADCALREIEYRAMAGDSLDTVRPKKVLFENMCDEYLVVAKANKTAKSYERDLTSTRTLLKVFRGQLLAEITPQELERYKCQRAACVAPSTVNRELGCIKHMFNVAVQWGYLRENRLRAVRKLKEPPGRVRYLNPDEIERLLACCSPVVRPIVIMALNTGMRKGEILHLRWGEVDLHNRLVKITRTKNNELKILPLNDRLYDLLLSLERGRPESYVFANPNGKPYRDVKKGFAAALRRAGIEDFRFHDLRHTFASRLVMAGVDIRTVQDLLGHKDIKMTMRYSHLSDVHMREAVKKVEVGTNLAQNVDKLV